MPEHSPEWPQSFTQLQYTGEQDCLSLERQCRLATGRNLQHVDMGSLACYGRPGLHSDHTKCMA